MAEQLPKSSQFLIYWKKPSEWADLVYAHIVESGATGSIVTVYELFLGDETTGKLFHGLPEVMWPRVLKPLQNSGKAAVFGGDGAADKITSETGIKFM